MDRGHRADMSIISDWTEEFKASYTMKEINEFLEELCKIGHINAVSPKEIERALRSDDLSDMQV